MPQRTMRRLVTATFAVGMIGGLAFGSPSAFADPEVPGPVGPLPDRSRLPRRRRRRPRRRSTRPPRSRRRPRAPRWRHLRRIRWPCRRLRPPATRSPPAIPSHRRLIRLRRAADDDPRGHARGPEPDAVHRRAGVRAAVLQSGQRLHGRRRQADHHQLPAADRRPPDGRAGDPHLVRPRRFPASSTG